MSRSMSSARWLWLTLTLAALASAVLLGLTSEDVPRADEWATPGEYIRARALGTATFARTVFRQHNESRPILSLWVAEPIARLWGWNQHIFHGINWALTLLTAFLFARLTANVLRLRTVRLAWPAMLVLCTAVALVFTPAQWRNLLSSGQLITIIIPTLLLAGVSVNVAERVPNWARYLTAAACSLVASFSFVNGLMLWFLLWPAPFRMVREGRRRLRGSELAASFAYFAVTVAVIVIFFAGYEKPAGHPSLAYGLRVPHHTALFAATWLAGPIFPEAVNFWMGEWYWIPFRVCGVLAGMTGVLLVASLATSWRNVVAKESLRTLFPFLPLLAYSVCSAISISLARVGLGQFGNLSRYSTVAIPGYLAMAAIVAVAATRALPATRQRLLACFAAVFATTVAVSAAYGTVACLVDRQAARQAALTLAFRHVAPHDPLLTNVYPERQVVSRMADDLEHLGVRRPGERFAWVDRATAIPRTDLTYQMPGAPVAGLVTGRIAPTNALEQADVILFWDPDKDQPVTSLLAPAPGNYPGKPDGVFHVRYEAALAGELNLARSELYLARPRTHALWKLTKASTPLSP